MGGLPSRPPAVAGPTAESRRRLAVDSVVTLLKDIDAAVCDSQNFLSLAHLLEWMDAASCLAAERHCGRSAVTLVMDDLDFTDTAFDLLKRGERCILEGKVTRAFGSSMEVVVRISVAHVHSGTLRMVGGAYFMYVVLKTDAEKASGTKVEVPELVPITAEEHLEYGLAERRRSFRKNRDQRVAALTKEPEPTLGMSPLSPLHGGSALTFTELVLPTHTNHMGNTFGGQIMAWMVKGAKTAVWLHLRMSCVPRDDEEDGSPPVGVGGVPRIQVEQLKDAFLQPVSVDTVHFKAPSRLGDRVLVTASVTRVFVSSVEVKVRVTSNSVDTQDEPREVNEGYLNFAVMGQQTDGVASGAVSRSDFLELTAHVADVLPGTMEQEEEHRKAVARQEFRELRRTDGRKAETCPMGCVKFSVDLHSEQAQKVAVQCLSCILCLNDNATLRWERLLTGTGTGVQAWVEFGLRNTASVTRLKVQTRINKPPSDCFQLLKDAERRMAFDVNCVESEILECFEESADLVRMVMAAPGNDSSPSKKPNQEILVLRAYQEEPEQNIFVLCSRSVRCDKQFPPRDGLRRSEVLPSGYIFEAATGSDGAATCVTFLGQFSRALFEMVQPHVLETVRNFKDLLEGHPRSPIRSGYPDVPA